MWWSCWVLVVTLFTGSVVNPMAYTILFGLHTSDSINFFGQFSCCVFAWVCTCTCTWLCAYQSFQIYKLNSCMGHANVYSTVRFHTEEEMSYIIKRSMECNIYTTSLSLSLSLPLSPSLSPSLPLSLSLSLSLPPSIFQLCHHGCCLPCYEVRGKGSVYPHLRGKWSWKDW